MDDYRKMYCKLFDKITDVINQLQTVQMETEEIFLSQEPERKDAETAADGKNAD